MGRKFASTGPGRHIDVPASEFITGVLDVDPPMHQPSFSDPTARGGGVFAALIGALLFVTGCGSGGMDASDGSKKEPALRDAVAALAGHRIREADRIYSDMLERSPNDGEAAAGAALTDILMIAEHEAAVRLLEGHLGASGDIDAERALYAPDGFFYWWSRGAPWEDEREKYDGIQNLISERLPWSRSRLDSLASFVEGLDQPAGRARSDLLDLAAGLREIEDKLETALSDPDFDRFVVPGEIFFDSDLTATLGVGEIALAGAVLATIRAGIRFAAAYDHAWTLERAFGPHWQQRADRADSAYPEAWDYTVTFLGERLFQSLHDESETHLKKGRDALREALADLRDGLDRGGRTPTPTVLRWDRVEPTYVEKIRDVAGALRTATEARRELPYTEPTTSADFSVLFDPGRTLDDDLTWFERTEAGAPTGDGDGDDPRRWRVDPRALQHVVVRGIFEPPFDLTDDEPDPHLTIDGQRFETFERRLTGALRARLQGTPDVGRR